MSWKYKECEDGIKPVQISTPEKGKGMEKAQIILDTEKYETYINEIEEALKEYKECVKELKTSGFIQERRKDESSINNRG